MRGSTSGKRASNWRMPLIQFDDAALAIVPIAKLPSVVGRSVAPALPLHAETRIHRLQQASDVRAAR